jgi:ribosome recycling factor
MFKAIWEFFVGKPKVEETKIEVAPYKVEVQETINFGVTDSDYGLKTPAVVAPMPVVVAPKAKPARKPAAKKAAAPKKVAAAKPAAKKVAVKAKPAK